MCYYHNISFTNSLLVFFPKVLSTDTVDWNIVIEIFMRNRWVADEKFYQPAGYLYVC